MQCVACMYKMPLNCLSCMYYQSWVRCSAVSIPFIDVGVSRMQCVACMYKMPLNCLSCMYYQSWVRCMNVMHTIPDMAWLRFVGSIKL